MSLCGARAATWRSTSPRAPATSASSIPLRQSRRARRTLLPLQRPGKMMELLDQGATAIATAVRTGKVKARDVAEAAIARVEARNKDLTAIVDFNPMEARTAADTVDARRKQGFDGPILGVPYTVKDTTWVSGRRVTNGSLLYKDFIPPRDAVAVERLKNAGGVFIGMTNTPEMAAKGHTENKVYGPSRNPANTALTPGGSSGGAAAALAAGFTPIALGTDGGGSGRRPAGLCGVVGLKTSAGAIPNPFGFGGAYGPLYGVTAPMGRTVADARVAFEVMAGPDPRDPDSAGCRASLPNGDRAGRDRPSLRTRPWRRPP